MHNYVKKLLALQAEGKVPTEKGKMFSTTVKNDDWCNVYKAGECNCDPEITFVEITSENRASIAHHVNEETAKFRDKMKKKMI
jgi:hypothetical protein